MMGACRRHWTAPNVRFAAGYLAGVVHGLDTEQRLAQAHRLAARALASTSDYVPNLPRPSEIQGVGGRT